MAKNTNTSLSVLGTHLLCLSENGAIYPKDQDECESVKKVLNLLGKKHRSIEDWEHYYCKLTLM